MARHFYISIFLFSIIFVNPAFADVFINSFDAKPKSGEAPLEVTLTCKVQTINSNIVEFQWDIDGNGTAEFIDTRSSTTSNYTYTYKVGGTYNPVCTVVDSLGIAVSSQPLHIFVYSCDGINGDYNNDGKLGLEDCIGILQELTK